MKLLLSFLTILLLTAPAHAEPFQARNKTTKSATNAKVAEGDNWYKKQQRMQKASRSNTNSSFTSKSQLKGKLIKKLGKRNADTLWSNLNN